MGQRRRDALRARGGDPQPDARPPRLLIVDAGPLVANIDPRDRHHAACAELLNNAAGPLVVPMLVVAEVSHLVREAVGAELGLLADLAEGDLIAEPVHPADWDRIAQLVAHYHDLPLGIVDASLVAAAERLRITTVATLDRRHLGLVRPAHTDALTLLP